MSYLPGFPPGLEHCGLQERRACFQCDACLALMPAAWVKNKVNPEGWAMVVMPKPLPHTEHYCAECLAKLKLSHHASVPNRS